MIKFNSCVLMLVLVFQFSLASFSFSKDEEKKMEVKEDVVDNPTLKTMSGSLKKWSLYSVFSYRGGSIEKMNSAEYPNIKNSKGAPSLAEFSGNIGVKYRASKQDNFSLQTGVFIPTPFHSSYEASNRTNQMLFDDNHQKLDVDNPTISYFRTYYLGGLQNITFLRFQYVTRDLYRDFRSLRSGYQLSHACAYRFNKAAYIAGSLTYDYLNYDSDTIEISGFEKNIVDKQEWQKLRANLTAELYVKRNISLRFITDLFSFVRMRKSADIEDQDLQQTVAMTYFFSRDVSFSPNVKFITKDIRSDRTNLGFTLNLSL